MVHRVLSTGDDDSLHDILVEDSTIVPIILTKDHPLAPLVVVDWSLDFVVPSFGDLMEDPPLDPLVNVASLSSIDLRVAPSLAPS